MALRIPITADVDEFTESVQLDGSTYTLAFSYSARTQVWCLSIYYLDNGVSVPVVEGFAVVADYPILAGVTHANRPKGELAFRVSGVSRDPGRDDLGTAAELIYFEASELL